MLNWTSVASSHIEAIAWDEAEDGTGRLWVRFKGGVYGHYSPCPEQMFQDMLSAPSKGQYKDRMLIKGGKLWTKANLAATGAKGTAAKGAGPAGFREWAARRRG
jgi:hypothetical protein